MDLIKYNNPLVLILPTCSLVLISNSLPLAFLTNSYIADTFFFYKLHTAQAIYISPLQSQNAVSPSIIRFRSSRPSKFGSRSTSSHCSYISKHSSLSGCELSSSGTFRIVVQNVSTSAVAKRQEAATQVAEYMLLSRDVPIPSTMLL